MRKVIYERQVPAAEPPHRYLVQWRQYGQWVTSERTFRTRFGAKSAAEGFTSIGYPVRVVDTRYTPKPGEFEK